MPVYRDKDGNIIEEKTVVAGRSKPEIDSFNSEDKTVVSNNNVLPQPPARKEPQLNDGFSEDDFYSQATVVNRKVGGAKPDSDGEVTRVFRRTESAQEGETQDGSPMDDPVVGWLVVIEGEGQGNFVKLGYGMNSIGRSDTDRVSLNFGDTSISRERHAALTYDTRQREFFLQQGDGKTLTYVNDNPVLQPTEIANGNIIDLGETRLRFVAFCGQEFDWINEE